MKTKKLTVELEEVKAAIVILDLGPCIESYAAAWLALSNHARETRNILKIHNFADNNRAEVVLDISEDWANEDFVRQFCRQFGIITSYEEETVYVGELPFSSRRTIIQE